MIELIIGCIVCLNIIIWVVIRALKSRKGDFLE